MASHSCAKPSVARPGIVLESTNVSCDLCRRRSTAIDPTYTTKNAKKKKSKKPKEPKAKENDESFMMKVREQNAYFNDIDDDVSLIFEKECENKAISPGVNDRASMYGRNDRESISAAEKSSFVGSAFQFVEKHGEVCPVNWHPGGDTIKPDPTKSKEYFGKQ